MGAIDRASVGVEDLAERLRGGSRDAFEEVYRRWSPLVLSMARRSLGDHHDAEDVAQQVFVAAWRGRHTLRGDVSGVPGWLVGITRHKVADAYAQRSRRSREAQVAASAVTPHHEAFVWDEALLARMVVADEIADLPEPRSSVVRLALLLDLPYPEIATRLDLPLGTVKSHVRRGLIRLKERLAEVTDDAS